MKGLLKHFLLSALLIFHTSFGGVMAAQMQTTHLNMGGFGSSLSDSAFASNGVTVEVAIKVATIDKIDEASEIKPCPHHSNNKAANAPTPVQVDQIVTHHDMSECSGHDCSNCNCINALSSIPTLTVSVDYLELDRSNAVSFTTSTFPDSPLDFILRPPIS